MTEAKQGFPDDRDRRLMKQAEKVSNFANEIVEWAGDHLAAREGTDFQIADDDLLALYTMRRTAANLCRSTNVPVAAAVYGASQVGKSLFVGRVLEPSDDRDSPLGLNHQYAPPAYVKELSFAHDINPQSGANEATALVTRFTTKERFDEEALPEYPVKIRALTRAEWIRVVARGFRSECRQPEGVVWREGQLRSLFEEVSKKHGSDKVDREWRLDVLDAYSYLRKIDVNRYETEESLFNAFLSRYPLTSAGYLEIAGRMFWDSRNFPAISHLFAQVCSFIQKVAATKKDGILVHWAAVKFLLDSQRSPVQDSPDSRWKQTIAWTDLKDSIKDGWYVIDYEPGAGGPSDDISTIQSAMLELVLPVIPQRLKSDWAEVIHKMDILDLPGMKAGGGDSKGGLTTVDSIPEKMNIVKRGKVFYLIDRYLEERQVQTLLLLVRGGGLDVRQLLNKYVNKWGEARYGEQNWPRKIDPANPALFIGLTGIDDEFVNSRLGRRLYENRLNMISNEMLNEVMKNFGGDDKPFTNIFPIRYPGSWDYNEQKRKRHEDPSRWDEAGKIFIESELVKTYVHNAEHKWDVAMRDNDGGLSLICKGLINCTTSLQKQNSLDDQIRSLQMDLRNLVESWWHDPSANQDRKNRSDSAAAVLAWLDDPRQVYDRVHALQNALCFDDGNAMQIAEFAEKRELRSAGRPETIQERFPKFLRQILGEWARDLVIKRWANHTSQHQSGAPWLSAEEFSKFSRFLSDYLCSDAVFDELSKRLLEIVTLPIRDAGDRRFAQRAYIRVILNDFVLNPGPDDGAWHEPAGVSPDGDVSPDKDATGSGASNGMEYPHGLMTPFVNRWKGRLSEALSSAAGEHTEIPAGNEKLRKTLDRYKNLP